MENINLQEYFTELIFRKLDKELKDYKATKLFLRPEELFNCAYEIDSYINIYETLIDCIEELESAQLLGLLIIPNILSFFYDQWLNFEDSRAEEMVVAINEIIKRQQVVGNMVKQQL